MELDNDFIDGCDINFASPSMYTTDEGAIGLVMFADVEFTDPKAIEQRKAEWVALFAEEEIPDEVAS